LPLALGIGHRRDGPLRLEHRTIHTAFSSATAAVRLTGL
jgi:hypothetical protein